MTKDKCPVELSTLVEYFNTAKSAYTPIFRKFRILDAVDRSKLWQALGAKFPSYQILPETNWVSYIKGTIWASIYTVAKSAQVLATSDEDRDAVANLNIALEYIWDTNDIAHYELQAGSSAALFNIGITQIGWNPDVEGGKDKSFYKGNIVLKNIHPTKYMRDPYAEDLDSASFCMTWESYHETILQKNPRYAEAFKAYKAKRAAGVQETDPNTLYTNRMDPASGKGYHTVYIYFVRYGDGKIAEIHTIDNVEILYTKEEIKPARFPFVELFCNLPEGDVVGTSEPAKILSNNIAYNIMDSMMLTSEYKNQRPPKFISSQSGLNLRTFSQYGNDADHTFIVNGDASRAVHYHEFPGASTVGQALQAGLLNSIKTTTGVDDRYTGRDTGSILTTGGMEDMLSRITMIDTPKIANYEKYTRNLTELILLNFMEFSMKRKYFKLNPQTNEMEIREVDYAKLAKNKATLYYSVNISSELPKNKQRVASMASLLMEKQMQYGGNQSGPDLITPEEWLEMQDLPFKERMLQRMNLQRMADLTAEVAETLFSYAGLVKQGVAPQDAISGVAQNLMARRAGQEPPIEVPPLVDPTLQAPTPESDPELMAMLDQQELGGL